MGFEDTVRMSVHAVIFDENNRALLLKANYGQKSWGLPGGAIEIGETVHETLKRECHEELGIDVAIKELTGIYYHKIYNSQVVLFRCTLDGHSTIRLSEEHTEYRYFNIEDMSEVQKIRVRDAFEFNGFAKSRKF